METDRDTPVQVSVLCLAYNHEKYIRQTLEGFVNQKTDFKFEVLIHDDASTDQTASIIAEYEARYPEIIKPIYQTENQLSKGVKIQRSFNFPRAKGKYFAWCEGDDYWCGEQKLQSQYDALESHPECDICLHKVQCLNEDGSISNCVIPESYYGFTGGGYCPIMMLRMRFGLRVDMFFKPVLILLEEVYYKNNFMGNLGLINI